MLVSAVVHLLKESAGVFQSMGQVVVLPCIYGISGCADSAANRVGGDASIHGGCEDTTSEYFSFAGSVGMLQQGQ